MIMGVYHVMKQRGPPAESDADQTAEYREAKSWYDAHVAPLLYLSLCFVAAAPEVACPSDPVGVERAQRLQADADAELEAGRGARAAELLGEVADAYPECRAYHGRRMMAIERALEQHRMAFAADKQRDHLVAALAQVDRYLASLQEAHGAVAEQTQGYERLTAARAELLVSLPPEPEPLPPVVTPDDPEAAGPGPPERPPERPPEPERSPDRGLRIGGGLAVGGGAIFLVMAIAGATRANALEREVEEMGCMRSLPGECASLDGRGHAANRVAVTGVIGSTMLVATGAALLGVAARRRAGGVRLGATLHPRFVGLTLQGHF